MTTINLFPGSKNNPLTFNRGDKTFYGSEREIPFDTSYEIKNNSTGASEVFNFVESTGSEWDPKTRWIYKNKSDLFLVISNDPEITNMRSESYLKSKIGKP